MAAGPAVAAGAPSYWCYSCERFVHTEGDAGLACPGCDGDFLEQMDAPLPRRAVAPSAPNGATRSECLTPPEPTWRLG